MCSTDVQALLVGEDQRRVVRVPAVPRIARALHVRADAGVRRVDRHVRVHRVRAARGSPSPPAARPGTCRSRSSCSYVPAAGGTPCRTRSQSTWSPTTSKNTSSHTTSRERHDRAPLVPRSRSRSTASRPPRSRRPLGIWPAAKLHALPGVSRPEHSVFSGPAACGGQNPASPQYTSIAFVSRVADVLDLDPRLAVLAAQDRQLQPPVHTRARHLDQRRVAGRHVRQARQVRPARVHRVGRHRHRVRHLAAVLQLVHQQVRDRHAAHHRLARRDRQQRIDART